MYNSISPHDNSDLVSIAHLPCKTKETNDQHWKKPCNTVTCVSKAWWPANTDGKNREKTEIKSDQSAVSDTVESQETWVPLSGDVDRMGGRGRLSSMDLRIGVLRSSRSDTEMVLAFILRVTGCKSFWCWSSTSVFRTYWRRKQHVMRIYSSRLKDTDRQNKQTIKDQTRLD